MDKHINTLNYILSNIEESKTLTQNKSVVTWLSIDENAIDLDLLRKTIDYLSAISFMVSSTIGHLQEELSERGLTTRLEEGSRSLELLDKGLFYVPYAKFDEIGFQLARFINAQQVRNDSYAYPRQTSEFQLSLIPDGYKTSGYTLRVERGSESEGLFPVSSQLHQYDRTPEEFNIMAEGILSITPGIKSYVVYNQVGKSVAFARVTKGDVITLLDTLGRQIFLGAAQYDSNDKEYLSMMTETILINGDIRKLDVGE